MKSIITILAASSLLLMGSIANGKSYSEISMEDAKNKTFTGNLCNKQYNRYILMPNETASASWEDGEGSKEKADQLVADTEEACKKSEAEVKAALAAMSKAWSAQCKKYNSCKPSTHTHDWDSSLNADKTNCANGSVTVNNVDNESMFCTYPVENGKAAPEFKDRKVERCYEGEEGGESGYGGASVSIPAAHREARYYIYLTCHQPNTVYDLRTFDHIEDVVEPKVPDEPKKSGEEPKKDK